MDNDTTKVESEQMNKETPVKTVSKRQMMTETPVPKLIVKLSIPTIISMLVTAFYNSADTYFVGRISTEATAAVGLVFSVMAIIQAMGFFCGHGSGNYLSRMLGADNKKEANEMASTGFAIAIILGVVIAVLGNIFADTIVGWLGATPDIVDDSKIYMRIILIGAPFMIGQFVVNSQLRFQGSAMYAMVGLLCGAAIATVCGQMISFTVLLIGSRRGENIRLSFKNIHINPHYLLEITNGGAPSLLRQGLASVSTLLLNRYAGFYGGAAAIAGMSIVTRVMMMLVSALIGFGQGYQPVCSYNYGAGLKNRVREGFLFIVRWGAIFLTIVGVLCFIFAPDIVRWFRNDDAVVAVGQVALRCQSVVLPLSAINIFTNMMLQSMGHGVKASITASARSGIFFIPLIIILSSFFGLTGVEITQTCADILTLSITLPFMIKELGRLK